MGFNHSAIGLVLALFVLHMDQNNAVTFKMTNAVCESYNKSWVIINECRLKAVSRNKTTFNFNGTFIYPTNNISQVVTFFKKANGYKPWVIKSTFIDCCKFLKHPYNPTAIMINSLFREFSNINHSCPYVGHQLVQGFYLRPELLGLPFPTGDYLLTMDWMFYKRKQFSTNVYFQYVENYIDM